MSLADRIIFAVTNAVIYLRHPRFILHFRRKQRPYWKEQGQWPNLAQPGTLSELIQWRKVFDRNPIFPVLSDKLAAKQWAKERLPELATPETVWVGKRPQDIPDRLVGADYVIKTNDGTSKNYFPGRQGTDRARLNQTVERWLAGPLKRRLRQLRSPQLDWGYKPIAQKLFVERVVAGTPLVDISVRACDGAGFLVSCATDYKTENARFGYFWPDGVVANAAKDDHVGPLAPDFEVPARLGDAVRYAELLSKDFDYLRVDFLTADNRLYLGEITLYPASGYGSQSWRTEAVYRFWLRAIHKSWPLSTPQAWPRSIYLGALRRWTDGLAAELGSPERFMADQRAAASG